MKTSVRTATALAALIAILGVANAAYAGGTIPSGPYPTVCDKDPKACGLDIELPPRPAPKPPKPPKPASYTPSHVGVFTSFAPLSVFR